MAKMKLLSPKRASAPAVGYFLVDGRVACLDGGPTNPTAVASKILRFTGREIGLKL
jgi:hypothetical protein